MVASSRWCGAAARGLLACALAASCAGCASTIRLSSDPLGARITAPREVFSDVPGVGDTVSLIAPYTGTIKLRPFQRVPVVVEAEGYRVLEVNLGRTETRHLRLAAGTLQRGGREVVFHLVPLAPALGAGPDDPAR